MRQTAVAESPARSAEAPDPAADRRAMRWVAGFAVLAAALRLPFVFTGLSTDEGGYAYVARQWARGARLYDTAWLDRPQGLLLVYRGLLALNGSGWTIRVGMVAAGVAITVLVAVIARLVAGRGAAVAAAGVYAVVGVGPHIEGMTLNGELLASVPAGAAIAAALWWRAARSTGWLVAAGLAAGLAMTMKQSGFDGYLVGLVVIATAGRGRFWRPAAIFTGAFAVPVAASVAHGIATGWERYWTALFGYQFAAIGGAGSNLGTRWHDFARSSGYAAWDLGVILLLALFGLTRVARRDRWVLGGWLVVGAVAINVGGSYWPHYYVQVLPPLAVLAAAFVAPLAPTADRPRAAPARRWVAVAALVLPTLVWLAALVPMTAAQRSRTIPYDALARRDDRIAAWIKAETRPDDRIYVLESEAYLYFAAQRQTSYPYLWGKPIDKIPDALPRLVAMLNAPDRPKIVVLDTPDPASVDPSGGIKAALDTHYHVARTIDGVVILRADD